MESKKISVEQRVAIGVVQNNADKVEDPIGEGRYTTAVKYTERWKIM